MVKSSHDCSGLGSTPTQTCCHVQRKHNRKICQAGCSQMVKSKQECSGSGSKPTSLKRGHLPTKKENIITGFVKQALVK